MSAMTVYTQQHLQRLRPNVLATSNGEGPDLGAVLAKAQKRALGGGLAGAAAMVRAPCGQPRVRYIPAARVPGAACARDVDAPAPNSPHTSPTSLSPGHQRRHPHVAAHDGQLPVPVRRDDAGGAVAPVQGRRHSALLPRPGPGVAAGPAVALRRHGGQRRRDGDLQRVRRDARPVDAREDVRRVGGGGPVAHLPHAHRHAQDHHAGAGTCAARSGVLPARTPTVLHIRLYSSARRLTSPSPSPPSLSPPPSRARTGWPSSRSR